MILREQTENYYIKGYLTLPRWFFKIKSEEFKKWDYEFIIEDEARDWVKVSFSDDGAHTSKASSYSFNVIHDGEYSVFSSFIPYKCIIELERVSRSGNTIIRFDPKTGERIETIYNHT